MSDGCLVAQRHPGSPVLRGILVGRAIFAPRIFGRRRQMRCPGRYKLRHWPPGTNNRSFVPPFFVGHGLFSRPAGAGMHFRPLCPAANLSRRCWVPAGLPLGSRWVPAPAHLGRAFPGPHPPQPRSQPSPAVWSHPCPGFIFCLHLPLVVHPVYNQR